VLPFDGDRMLPTGGLITSRYQHGDDNQQ